MLIAGKDKTLAPSQDQNREKICTCGNRASVRINRTWYCGGCLERLAVSSLPECDKEPALPKIHLPSNQETGPLFIFEGEVWCKSDLVALTDEEFADLFNRAVDYGCDLYNQLETAQMWAILIPGDESYQDRVSRIGEQLEANTQALDALEEEFERRMQETPDGNKAA
jgi:hypothetical protein